MEEERGMKVEAAGRQVQGAEETAGLGKCEQVLFLKKGARRERLGCATTAKERISKMPPCVAGKRSSIYRGVTRHRWTGRYEAHLWDKSTWNQNQNKKGKQVYLGAYDDEEAAARAYDLAALKYWGAGTLINFPVSDYSRDIEEMQNVSKEEYLVSLRRKSSAFSRGFPKCRGINRNSQTTPLEASLGQMLGSDYCNSLNFNGETESLVKNYASGFCMERKINLTGYLRWWFPKRPNHSDSFTKSYDEKYSNPDDVSHELRLLECTRKPTEPYQLPFLGLRHESNSRTSAVSASDFLAQSAAFKSFQQKIKEMHDQDGACSKEENNDNSIPVYSNCVGVERAGISMGLNDLPLQRTSYLKSPIPSTPKTDWNSVDQVSDPMFWASFVSPTSLPIPASVRKTETTSYAYNCKE